MKRRFINWFKHRTEPDPRWCKCGAGITRQHLLSCSPLLKNEVRGMTQCKECGRIKTVSGDDMYVRAALMVLLNQERKSRAVIAA